MPYTFNPFSKEVIGASYSGYILLKNKNNLDVRSSYLA
jgi:hypothetical protein